ncbi:MAG: hypothetical protein WDO14_23170 [Bacteroidota bacterium]
MKTILPVMFLLLIMSSCVKAVFNAIKTGTSLHYVTSVDNLHIDDKFTGLDDFIKSQPGPVANVLMIHGLTNKEPRHFDYLVERLAYKLRLKLDASKKQLIDSGTTEIPRQRSFGYGKWELYRWHFTADDYPNKDINFYFIYWSPITQPAKKFLLQYNKTDYRTRLAVMFKDSLFINLFGDLALFINADYKSELYSCFTTSLDHIKGPTAVVGSGFGVQMMFEAAQFKLFEEAKRRGMSTAIQIKKDSLAQEKQGIGVHEQTRGMIEREKLAYNKDKNSENTIPYYDITKIFLINNQLPFTGMLTLSPETPAKDELLNRQMYWAMSKFMTYSNRLHPQRPIREIDVVSFYDPNDPFGYRLPPYGDSIKVTNASVNTAEYWMIDPRKATDFIMPKIKSPKMRKLVIGMIDQENNEQKILTNFTGPAEQSRTDFRIISAIASGSKYPLTTMKPAIETQYPRDIDPKAREEKADFITRLKASIGESLITKIKDHLTVTPSNLPFAEPSTFKDCVPDIIRAKAFKGIDASVGNNSLTQIMTIHGVGPQEPDHFDGLTNAIAEKLGFYGRPLRVKVACAGLPDCGNVGPIRKSSFLGTVKIHEYEGTYGKKLIIYNVYWSSIVTPAKQWLDSLSIYDESSVVTRMIKKFLINDGFTDIEMTFKQYRDYVESTIETAYKEMDNDFTRPGYVGGPRNTYYITGSLGTKLLLDFLKRNRHYLQPVSDVQSRTRTWFMLTNQLIMTAFKDIELKKDTVQNSHIRHDSITYEDFYQQAFGVTLDLIEDKQSPFDIVAFNDPNDLLSFVVPDSVMGIGAGREKIHNNYVNLASGFQVNMNGLIKYVRKADKYLSKKHRSEYNDRIRALEKVAEKAKSNNDQPLYVALCEEIDMLKIACARFSQDKTFNPKTRAATDSDILELLTADPAKRDKELGEKLLEKKKLYLSNLYLADSSYDRVDKIHNQLLAKYSSKQVISDKSMRRLYQPGLLMSSLRNISNNFLFQDFVVDFGTAHVGAKSNKVVSELISHGFEPAPKTVNNQDLYHRVHNKRQD